MGATTSQWKLPLLRDVSLTYRTSVGTMSVSPSLSVVVPATDDPPTLDRCLAAIAEAHDAPTEVIVVDGPRELTVCEARNTGVERSSGDVVVFVDSDVEVHPDAFTRIRAVFADDPDLAAVHGSYDDRPADRSTVSVFRNLLHHHVHQANAGPAETFWSGLGAVRRTAFDAVGGFDEARYRVPSIEDIDLGHRLWARGERLRLDPTIQGTHLKRWGLWNMVRTDFARRGVPWMVLQLRNRRLASTLNCGWQHRLGALACVVAVLALVLGRPLVSLGALAVLVATNGAFHRLLVRELGWIRGVLGIGLHALHHLVAVAAVPAALVVAIVSPRVRSATGTEPEHELDRAAA